MSIDFAIPAVRNVIKKEAENSQQSVQFVTQHVNNTVQKSPCMSFHRSGGTVTVVKHNIYHSWKCVIPVVCVKTGMFM